VSEVGSLLAPVANSVQLKVKTSAAADKLKIYGYKPNKKSNGFTVNLDNLNLDATQVVIFEMPADQNECEVTATLSYVDAISGKSKSVQVSTSRAEEPAADDLAKNYSIALIADGIRKSAGYIEKGKLDKANQHLSAKLKDAKKVFGKSKD